ncbi:hypothetical protein CR513_45564, partial [Mucuna pruriens]
MLVECEHMNIRRKHLGKLLVNPKTHRFVEQILSLPTKKYQRLQDFRGIKNRRQVCLEDGYHRTQPLECPKTLRCFPWKNFLGTLKVHEMKLNEDEEQRKGKSITLKAQKASKGPKPSR